MTVNSNHARGKRKTENVNLMSDAATTAETIAEQLTARERADADARARRRREVRAWLEDRMPEFVPVMDRLRDEMGATLVSIQDLEDADL